MTASKQLPLAVNLPENVTLDNFVVGDNAVLMEHLRRLTNAQQHEHGAQITYLSGDAGVGKSHLLFALCQCAEQSAAAAVYIGLRQYADYSPEILDNLSQYQIICIDDVDAVAGTKHWEQALFALINQVKQSEQVQLVITANAGVKQLTLDLPDLQSRLAWGISFQISELSDDEKVLLLVNRANERGMQLPAEVSRYICQHWRRDMHSLMQSLDRLDQLSLEQKRKLTLPFVKQALSI